MLGGMRVFVRVSFTTLIGVRSHTSHPLWAAPIPRLKIELYKSGEK